ncbi:hypothetical protein PAPPERLAPAPP_04240 [Brevundimonas phage vB_BpoS-Papperlapapp]|uniref:Uncharacterized protein n=1 Tax=Brevundimonas phage vB_BpoS-Domovoi TaxID=2948598 RepID=A0A9E7MQI8_9CAUD|nr:hypothetical protein DOMOVOI_03190 [Brevundimonas phage vB_BpoS-Domovoi]USN16165.1 hypothetical protein PAPPERLAPAPP_04240 [Brevundimonas phage vB_BpoS-Papperlapapp]
MRLIIAIALAWLWASLLASDARAGDPETCEYVEPALSDACRADPDVRAYLLEPRNLMVERLVDIPPVVRGWLPGEEARVIRLIQEGQAGCRFLDRDLARACLLDERVRETLVRVGRGVDTPWFALPSDVGGWGASMTNPRITSVYANEGATRQRLSWGPLSSVSPEERMEQVARAVTRATGREVEFARLYLVAVDGVNFIACGYGFYSGAGEAPSAGLFVFDSRGGSALRAPASMFNAKCLYADRVLR